MSTGQKRGQGRDGAKEDTDRAWREGEEEEEENVEERWPHREQAKSRQGRTRQDKL